jgi:hypothetical protein
LLLAWLSTEDRLLKPQRSWARLSSQQAEQARAQAENEKMALRERLRQQLSTILETRETQRGLIVNKRRALRFQQVHAQARRA